MKSTLNKQANNVTGSAWKDLINALKPKDIEVSVNNGDVVLKGIVNSYQKRARAEKIVGEIAGVRSITNEIVVRFSRIEKVKDSELKESVLYALAHLSETVEKTSGTKIENENFFGNKIPTSEMFYMREERKAQLNFVVPAKEMTKNESNKEMAYWEVFG
jgi:hypothetical protein